MVSFLVTFEYRTDMVKEECIMVNATRPDQQIFEACGRSGLSTQFRAGREIDFVLRLLLWHRSSRIVAYIMSTRNILCDAKVTKKTPWTATDSTNVLEIDPEEHYCNCTSWTQMTCSHKMPKSGFDRVFKKFKNLRDSIVRGPANLDFILAGPNSHQTNPYPHCTANEKYGLLAAHTKIGDITVQWPRHVSSKFRTSSEMNSHADWRRASHEWVDIRTHARTRRHTLPSWIEWHILAEAWSNLLSSPITTTYNINTKQKKKHKQDSLR